MDIIKLSIVEPDMMRREWLATCLCREVDFRVIGMGGEFLEACQSSSVAQVDVLIVNVDSNAMTRVRTWAAVHVLLLEARVVALTTGVDDGVLETTLGAGVTALHLLDVEPSVLCRAVRNAARGVVDFDPALIERAKGVVLQPLAEGQVRYGGLTIDLAKHEATRWGRHVHLTRLEFKVLAYLAGRDGHPTSLEELLVNVWQASVHQGGTLAQVHNCIKRIRQKIEPDARHPRYLCCERGWGYYLNDPTHVVIPSSGAGLVVPAGTAPLTPLVTS